uniref:hypothetical protein n=1 Tax=Aeromonas hydrophila TaxID=644 RepID=UPI001CC5A80D
QDSDFHERAKEKLTHIPFVDVQKERLIADSGEQLPPPHQLGFGPFAGLAHILPQSVNFCGG